MHRTDDSDDRQPWSTPRLRQTDAASTANGPGIATDGYAESNSTISIV